VLSVVGPDFRETGDVPLDGQLHILFRLRDGRITHMHDYRRLEEALAAAESPPPSVQPRETVADLGPAAPERARAVGFVPFLDPAEP
jgi:hypothetical protein